MKWLDKINREVKYVNRDFSELRQSLINYTKNYFPNTYSDFNEASPGMAFIEMCAYVGDVINFYSDVQLQESLLFTVQERKNLNNIAQSLGYKARTVSPSLVDLDVFQQLPSIGEGDNVAPDWRYALSLDSNMTVLTQGTSPAKFYTLESVDFGYSSSIDPTETTVYEVSSTGQIEKYLLKKKVRAVAGEVRTATYVFGEPKPYDKIVIQLANVTGILDIVDSDGNSWYEVPYLAQDIVPISIQNTRFNIPSLAAYRDSTPYILHWKQTERRFITRLRNDQTFEIQFGGGLSSEADEEIVPNPFNVALGLEYFKRVVDVSMDPMNFLHTRTYGSAPSNTTLTIRYTVANGFTDNAAANTITQVSDVNVRNPIESVDTSLYSQMVASLAVNNPNPAFGGADEKPIETVREEAMANFAAQNRCVTREDYIVRAYTMPAKYGSIAKAYIEQDTQFAKWNEGERVPNPYALNLYTLCYDSNKNFTNTNVAIKQNIKNYLSQYRLMTDAINLKEPYIVNIGVDFEIITRPNYNSNEVLLRCNEKLMDLLSSDRMEVSAPILVSKLYTEIDRLDGVQTVQNITFKNLYDSQQGYSPIRYNIQAALREGILYSSIDPMIFEVKFPNKDIRGRVNDL